MLQKLKDVNALLHEVLTRGNVRAHLVLRGGQTGLNCRPEHITHTEVARDATGFAPTLVVDCGKPRPPASPPRKALGAHHG